MALVNDHLGSDAFIRVSTLKLSSSPFPSTEKDAQTGVSINDNLRLTDQHIKDGLSCLKQLKQGAHHQHVSSEELERKRISRELHDGLGQLLTSMSLHVQR
ncbi:MAG: histidine kinase, partial [Candidatus Thiodiazotropha taylori]